MILFNNDVQHQIEKLNDQISFRKILTIYFDLKKWLLMSHE